MELRSGDDRIVIPLEREKFMCGVCNKAYSAKYNVYDHMRKAHNVEPQAKGNVKCPLCGNFTHSYTILRTHLEEAHEEKIDKEELAFPSMEEFENWKRAIEDETNSRYVNPTGIKRLGSPNKCKIYYTCHRSGFFKSKSTGRKKVKLQGSCKINATCPSTIEAVINKATGAVGVTYWKNHVGHTTDIQHLTLTQEERTILAEKMLQGASFEQILREIRLSAKKSDVKRIHLLRKQDLRNIKRNWRTLVDSNDASCVKNESQDETSEDFSEDFESAASESQEANVEDFESADANALQHIGFASSDTEDDAWEEDHDVPHEEEQEDEESDSDPSDALTMHDKLELLVKMSSTIYHEDVTEVNECLSRAICALRKLNPAAATLFLAHKRRKFYESQNIIVPRKRKCISEGPDSDVDEGNHD